MKVPPKLAQQLDVRGIADWLAGRVGLDGQVETGDRVQSRKVSHGHVSDQAALDPADLRFGEPDGPADRSQTESSIRAGLTDLETGPSDQLKTTGRPDVDMTRLGSHVSGASNAPLT